MDADPQENQRGIGRTNDKQSFLSLGESYFLGIGIDKYTHFHDLKNAKKDVVDIARLLTTHYDVKEEAIIPLYDSEATCGRIMEKLDALRSHLKSTDKLIIYFSGHGYLDRWKKGYWVPADGDTNKPSSLLSNSQLKDYLETIAARHILVISDSCYSGSMFYTGGQRGGTLTLEDKLEARKSRWALCSGHKDEKVLDGQAGENSPFARAILDYLRSNEALKFRVSSLVEYVLEITGSNYEQTAEGNPVYGVGHEGGQYIFRTRAAAQVQIPLTAGESYRSSSRSAVSKAYEQLNADREEVRRWLVNWGKYMGLTTLLLVVVAIFVTNPFIGQFILAAIPILYLCAPLLPLYFSDLSRSNLYRLTSLHGIIYYSFLLIWTIGSEGAYAWWQFGLMVTIGIVGSVLIIPLKSKR